MKNLLISALAVVAMFSVVASSAQAQAAGPAGGKVQGQAGKGGPQAGRNAWMKDAMKELNLSADQQKKMTELMKKQAEKMKELREKSGGDRTKMREEFMKFRQGQEAEMKKILTKEQWTKWEKIREEQMKKMRGQGGAGRPGAGRPGAGGKKGGGGNIPPVF